MTCRHFLHYNAGIMKDSSTQITIRGLDPETKARLTKKAAQKGLSLNKYSLAALKQAAGTETTEERYKHFVSVIDKHRIPSEDIKAAEEAIAWMDKASLKKQRRDERELGF